MSNSAFSSRVQHGVACTVGNEAGSPFLCAAEVALTDQTSSSFAFSNGNFFTVNNNLTVSRSDTAPWNAPSSQFTDSFRCGVDEHTGNFLVATPVRTSNCVTKVNVFVITYAFNNVCKRSLHTALRSLRVRTFWRNQRQDDGVMAACFCTNSHTQASESCADDENIRVYNFHLANLLEPNLKGRDGTFRNLG